jgi:hypothetical protein
VTHPLPTRPASRPAGRRWLLVNLPAVFPPSPVRPRRRRTVLIGVAAVLVGTAASLLRHPAATAFDTVWAEDGAVFLADAVNRPAGEALLTSYAGYFHLVPRLLGMIAAAVPAAAAPAAISVAAALVTAALAVLVYAASAGHLRSPVARVLVAAPVVVAPLGMQEVPNSVANLHWPALYAVFWLLLWTPAGRGGRRLAPTVVALVALSDFLVLAFLPLAVARLAVLRDRYSAILAAVLAAGATVQVLGLALGASTRENLELDPVRPIRAYLLHVGPSAVFGERWLIGHGDPRIVLAAGLAWLLIAAAVVVAVRVSPRDGWPLAATAAVHSVAVFALPVALTGVAPPRYGFAPALMLLAALVAILQPAPPPAPAPARTPNRRVPERTHHDLVRTLRSRRAMPFAVLTVMLTVTWAVNFRVDTVRDHGPLWSDQREQARAECASTPAATATLAITPDPWEADLSCGYLTGDGRP